MKFIFLFFSFFSLAKESFSQQKKSPLKNDILYAGIINPLTISGVIKNDKLTLKSDRGEIYESNGKYSFFSNEMGFVNISVSKKNDKSVVDLGTTRFSIALLRKPVFMLGNGMARMPAVAFANYENAEVVLNSPPQMTYEIKQFMVEFIGLNSNTHTTVTNYGSHLNEEIRLLFKNIQPGDLIFIGGVKAIDLNGKIVDVDPQIYRAY